MSEEQIIIDWSEYVWTTKDEAELQQQMMLQGDHWWWKRYQAETAVIEVIELDDVYE